MANDNFVDVQISVSDQSISLENFGLPMVVTYHTVFAERAKLYADSAEAIEDGFDEESPTVKMIDAIKAQRPCPPYVAVGRRALAFEKSWELSPQVTTEGFVYSFTFTKLSGATPTTQAVSYTVPGSATATSVATAIAAIITAFSGLTATAALGVITVDVDTAGELWSITRGAKVQQEALHLEDVTADPGIATDLQAIRDFMPAFYGVALDSCSKAEALAAAAKVATWSNVIFMPETSDTKAELGTEGNILLSLVALQYANVAVPAYHRTNTASYMTCRMMGYVFAKDPGSVSWAHKALAGMPSDDLSSSAIAYLKASDGVCYVQIREGVYGTHGEWAWKACSGEWMDVVRGIDWLTAVIKAEQIGLIAANDKIAFTDSGISLHEATLRGSLAQGAVNVLDGATVAIQTPLASSFTAAQKATRVLSGLTFTGTLQGAITAVTIRGAVTA